MDAVEASDEAIASSSQGVLRQLEAPLGIALVGAVVFSQSKSAFGRELPGLHLPGQASAVAAGINAHAGVLGVLESGCGAEFPPAGHAALAGGLGDGVVVVAVACAVLAVIAAAWTGRGDRRTWREPEIEVSHVADVNPPNHDYRSAR